MTTTAVRAPVRLSLRAVARGSALAGFHDAIAVGVGVAAFLFALLLRPARRATGDGAATWGGGFR